MTLFIKRSITFEALISGTKTIEARIFKGFICTLNCGNLIHICHGNADVVFTIISITCYDTFEDMLLSIPIHNILPYVDTYEDGISLLHTYYSDRMLENNKVVAIELQKIS